MMSNRAATIPVTASSATATTSTIVNRAQAAPSSNHGAGRMPRASAVLTTVDTVIPGTITTTNAAIVYGIRTERSGRCSAASDLAEQRQPDRAAHQDDARDAVHGAYARRGQHAAHP